MDSSNKELNALLVKAKTKYLEVEGREFGAPHQAPPVSSAKNEDITTRVAVRMVSYADNLLLPTAHRTVIASGVLQEVTEGEELRGGFTRIQIQDTDSDEEDEEANTVERGGHDTIGKQEETFTRIAITTSDDDEDDGDDQGNHDPIDGGKPNDDKSGESFTRIAITMDSESEDSDDEEAKLLQDAIDLKNKGNDLMQKGDLEGALAAYTASLKVVPDGDNAIAVYCNRSLTYIKLKASAELFLFW